MATNEYSWRVTIDAPVSPELDVHLVMDNCGTHKTRAWFARHPRFHVHFTPTSASWLNQVERWFAALAEKRNGSAVGPGVIVPARPRFTGRLA